MAPSSEHTTPARHRSARQRCPRVPLDSGCVHTRNPQRVPPLPRRFVTDCRELNPPQAQLTTAQSRVRLKATARSPLTSRTAFWSNGIRGFGSEMGIGDRDNGDFMRTVAAAAAIGLVTV